MKKQVRWKKIMASLNALHLADKCLLFFMVILMVQSAYTFFQGASISTNDTMDIIVRTTAAAIFGYFVSGNFQNGSKNATEMKNENSAKASLEISPVQLDNQIESKIGFSIKTENQNVCDENRPSSCANNAECHRNRLQILVVATIGIFALLVLIIVRNYVETNAASVATISQLRDFVSGSVGFLIGHTTHEQK